MKLVMIGCGHMGSALLNEWVKLPDLAFTIVAPSRPAVPEPALSVASPAELVGQTFDGIVVAVKPQVIDSVIHDYINSIQHSPESAVISIAAGTPLAYFEGLFPNTSVIRMMPNMPANIGQGMTGLVCNAETTVRWRDTTTRMADASGESLWVGSEDALNRLTAISGSGPAYVLQFIECLEAAARNLGFSEEEAGRLVRQTVVGAGLMAKAGSHPPAELKASVMSKGGTTAAGVAALNETGAFNDAISRAAQAAFKRATELAGD